MRFGQRPMAVLKTLTVSQVDELRAIGTVRTYRKNEAVYELGQPTGSFCLVVQGRVRLRDRDRDGGVITVTFAAEGEAFGLEALAGLPRRALSASAAENSEILSVEGGDLQELFKRDSTLTRHLLLQMSAAVLHAEERIKMLAFLDVPSRLASTILWLADRYGRTVDRIIEVPYWFTHQEMADLIGSTRETVTTVLADFKKHGLIDSRNHHFVVLDRAALTSRIRLPDFGESSGSAG